MGGGMADVREFLEGEVIFTESSPCDGVYIVTSGLVGIYAERERTTVELSQIGKGGMFGEMATIDLEERSAGARAIRHTTVVHLGRDEFADRLQKLPLWALLLIQMLVKRLRVTNKLMLASRAELARLHASEPVEDELAPERLSGRGLVRESDIHPEKIVSEINR